VSEKSCEEKENKESKIIWNGADVTPLPLWGDDFNLAHVCTSWLSSTDEDKPGMLVYVAIKFYWLIFQLYGFLTCLKLKHLTKKLMNAILSIPIYALTK